MLLALKTLAQVRLFKNSCETADVILDGIDNARGVRHSGGMAKPALGRGLGALLGGSPIAKPPGLAPALTTVPGAEPATDTHERVQRVPLGRIHPCPFQPRKDFAPETLRELADSIKEQGIVQPLIVRERDGHFELIAGERRWRAAQLLGLADVPVILRQADDRAVLELALIENLQREDLNPVEEAEGYHSLTEQFALSHEEIALRVGKARATVTNALRLLALPEEIKQMLVNIRLSAGHAKALLAVAIDEEKCFLARRAVEEGWSVRVLEKAVERLSRAPRKPRAMRDDIPAAHLQDLSDKLHRHFGTSVRLVPSRTLANGKKAKGLIEIDFYSNEDLTRILDLLGLSDQG